MYSFTTDAARSKECKKIGAVPKGNTCAGLKLAGYVPIITSKDQCSLTHSKSKMQNEASATSAHTRAHAYARTHISVYTAKTNLAHCHFNFLHPCA